MQKKRIAARLCAAVLLFGLCVVLGSWETALAQGDAASPGFVYTMGNRTNNSVIAYTRSATGTLTLLGQYSTQGSGNGRTKLNSQGAVLLTGNHKNLFVVNTLSNEITSFAVQPNGSLVFVNKVSSGGTEPVSLTVRGNLLFVLNQRAPTPNIVGFTVSSNGTLTAIPGAVASVGTATSQPAQVGFNSSGVLVVTEKLANKIDTYTVNGSGIPIGPLVQNSNGTQPFGFAFDLHGHLIVSEAQSASMSSYSISSGGVLRTISAAVPDTQGTPCWVVNTNNSTFPAQYSYTTNNLSGTISTYTIGPTSSLTLLNATAVTGLVDDIDMLLVANSTFLYVLSRTGGTLGGYSVGSDGSLTQVTNITGITNSVYGLAGF